VRVAALTEAVSKGFVDGTHRSLGPEQTLARVTPMLDAMGITRVADITGLDRLEIPVVTVYRPNARSLSVSQGKGLSLAAAKASGVMEAIENYHAERIVRPLTYATFNDIRFSHPVVDLERLPRLSVSTFHENQRTLWIEGFELSSRTPMWVPYELVHTDFTLPLPPGSGAFVMSSNGLASGNHLLEAIGHGLCELVERDATTLFRRTPAPDRKLLELSSVDDPACRDLLDRLHRADLLVGVWDVTSDVGLPCFLACIVDRRDDPFRPMYANQGMGCHPARVIALARALTEAAQSRLTFISGSRDDADRERYRHVRSPAFVAGWRERILSPEAQRVHFHSVRSFDHATFDADVALGCKQLAAIGIEQVVVVDLTRDEFEIPVVRVIVPGLEPFDEVPGYRPGPRALAADARFAEKEPDAP
jgi:ribosomal protein S12 methylthiotransferase accessory factor